ncbi:hypothetical protein N431DRAFT_430136 [Stipitochalara longipes BDJ]|nr:hypothetical protein N431DRAFT_430136 [Stipitochalara longipes BDJ]
MQGHASGCNSRLTALKRAPNLIHHFLSMAGIVPAITLLNLPLLDTQTTEDPARSYQPSVFAARCTIALHLFHWPVRWIGLIRVKMEV